MIRIECESEVAELFSEIADAAYSRLSLCGEISAELVFCSAEQIREINSAERGIDKVTDVLSFPALNLTPGDYPRFTREKFPFDTDPESGRVNLGSIVICEEVAASQAEEYGHSEEREKGYLFLHGLLHLLGYDHIEDSDRTLMRREEEAVLSLVGLERK